MISACIDHDINILTSHGALVWMPSHSTPATIGNARKSDHREITAVDWRANRLADALAKAAAGNAPGCHAIDQLLRSADVLVRHEAAVLGASTALANGFEVSAIATDGSCKRQWRRDSTGKRRAPAPPALAVVAMVQEPPAPPLPPQPPQRQRAPAQPRPARHAARAASARAAVRLRAAADEARTRAFCNASGELARPTSAPPAAARLAALRDRIIARAQ